MCVRLHCSSSWQEGCSRREKQWFFEVCADLLSPLSSTATVGEWLCLHITLLTTTGAITTAVATTTKQTGNTCGENTWNMKLKALAKFHELSIPVLAGESAACLLFISSGVQVPNYRVLNQNLSYDSQQRNSKYPLCVLTYMYIQCV